MFKLIKFSIIFLLILNIFSSGVLIVNAAEELLPAESNRSNCPDSSNCGGYTLNDMVRVVLIISEFILGLVGSLALLAFIAGGLMWLLSSGKAELVTRGKQTIIGAVVGLAIVFTSFMIIQLVYSALGIEQAAEGRWAVSTWFDDSLYYQDDNGWPVRR